MSQERLPKHPEVPKDVAVKIRAALKQAEKARTMKGRTDSLSTAKNLAMPWVREGIVLPRDLMEILQSELGKGVLRP